MLVDSDSRFLMQNLMLVPKTLLGSIVRWISRDSRVTVCSSGIGPPYSRRRGLCCRDSCVAHETSTQSVSQHPWHKEGTVTSFKLLLPLCPGPSARPSGVLLPSRLPLSLFPKLEGFPPLCLLYQPQLSVPVPCLNQM